MRTRETAPGAKKRAGADEPTRIAVPLADSAGRPPGRPAIAGEDQYSAFIPLQSSVATLWSEVLQEETDGYIVAPLTVE